MCTNSTSLQDKDAANESASEDVFIASEATVSEASAASSGVASAEGGASAGDQSGPVVSQEQPSEANGPEESEEVWRRRQSLLASGEESQAEGTESSGTPRTDSVETDGESGISLFYFSVIG